MINALFSFLLLFLTPKTTYVPLNQAEELLNASVLIRGKQYTVNEDTHEVKTGMVGCSGTFISSNTVITAGHCFSRPTTHIWVRSGNGIESYTATLLKLDEKADLALLRADVKKPHAFALLGGKVAQGSDITAVGSPFGIEFLLSQGIVSKTGFKLKPKAPASFILHTAMINSGSSGGGVFDRDGRLVGVNTITLGGIFGWVGISGAVDLTTIQKFLEVRPVPEYIFIIR